MGQKEKLQMIILPESTTHNFLKINSMLKVVPLGTKQIHKSNHRLPENVHRYFIALFVLTKYTLYSKVNIIPS